MPDDLLVHPALRRLVQGDGPTTFERAQLRQLRYILSKCDALRARNTHLEERHTFQETRIDMLRRMVGLHRVEVEQLQTLANGAIADRDAAVLERDQAQAELHATEEQVAALRYELDQLRAGAPA